MLDTTRQIETPAVKFFLKMTSNYYKGLRVKHEQHALGNSI